MTEMQKKVYEFIVKFYKENNVYPSYSEIGDGVQKSKSVIYGHMMRLIAKGYIVKYDSKRYKLKEDALKAIFDDCEGGVKKRLSEKETIKLHDFISKLEPEKEEQLIEILGEYIQFTSGYEKYE